MVRVPPGPFSLHFTFNLIIVFLVHMGRLRFSGLGFKITVKVILWVGVSFYVYSTDTESFWTTSEYLYIQLIQDRLLLPFDYL